MTGVPQPIRRLLVANRGEIARRIQRTAATMGIGVVAVYSADDADAPHVTEADAAVALRGRGAEQTYLDIDQILVAAQATGADAIHPGYGFLSEHAGFARAVVNAGLVWVGPPPEAIEAMGDKLRAKELMAAAGVPVLPSFVGEETVDIGWPVLVKATAGGGGKGMQIVERPEDYPEALLAAKRQAKAAFGDDTVFVERYLTDARHVEIQVLADNYGTVVHCFERDCSVQRRHQKVVEESPSPFLGADLRVQMTEAALAAARAVGYRSAGTVEFVVGPDGEFWFLEVNTRLQVEHPVTEAVTGLDLVRQQLLIAQGEALSFTQEELQLEGHAIEVRLYAEDPAAGFLPATGTIVGWRPPAHPAVRFDSGIEVGSVVGVEWDPLLAKVIAHAPTRSEAALRLALALERTVIRGVTTNRDFLVATLRHPQFLAGNVTTSFIDRVSPTRRYVPNDADLRTAAMVAALVRQAESRTAAPVLGSLPSGFRNGVFPAERSMWNAGDRQVEVKWRRCRDGRFAVESDGHTSAVRLRQYVVDETPNPGAPTGVRSVADRLAGFGSTAEGVQASGGLGAAAGRMDMELDGRRLMVGWQYQGRHWWVQGPAGEVTLHEVDRFPEPVAQAVAGGLVAPMPGVVASVAVSKGAEVGAGQLLVIVEAMKMEHRLNAPRAGRVVDVPVAVGDQVASGDLLVVLDEEGTPP